MDVRLAKPDGETPRVGLLAGSGRFPIVFAQAARRCGLSVCGVGVEGMASDELADACDIYDTTPLARFGRAMRLFHRAGVNQVVMAGKIEKTVLIRPFIYWRLM